VVLLLRALLVMMMMMMMLSRTHNKRVSKKTKKERERGEKLSHNTQKLKKKRGRRLFCVCDSVLCPHEKCTDRSHVWFKTTPLFFRPKFFLSLSLSRHTKNTLFKTLNDILREEKTKKNLGKKKVETFGRGGGALLL